LPAFGDANSFDEWFAATDHPVPIEQVGFDSFAAGSLAGYVVNDIALRTPAFLAFEACRWGGAVVALPYFAVRHAFDSSSSDAMGTAEALAERDPAARSRVPCGDDSAVTGPDDRATAVRLATADGHTAAANPPRR